MEFDPGSSGPVTMARVEAAAYRSSSDRVHGYFAALAEAGIDPCAVPIHETLSDQATVFAALDAIFAAPEPPTAILAQSDAIAFVALEWFAARGLAVPRDVSIVGFDGVPESARTTPPLTTVQQPIAEIGRRAVSAILAHADETWREKLDVTLVVRGSTAPPPA
jgi:DNA-binding LacI/PurR family transcriptional regulator